MTHKLKHTENTFSRSGGRASEAKEAEGAPQVEAGKRLEELRRRRGETESEEFEKLKQKQQEAALELEELKKKREERRKVLEEEEQRRKQEEAERKVREEVRRAQPAQPSAPQLTPAPECLSLVTLLAQRTISSLVK
ncbi:non-muscle caldesmon-like [Myotis lucifugus]|uniref:non-muscle caldesmon-like n=1 Tax=Myotis lucifugus TaxID=59463 RepID=UPI000CCC765C|nr:non-muscle caldesmon-like [Myotis lucifugus]